MNAALLNLKLPSRYGWLKIIKVEGLQGALGVVMRHDQGSRNASGVNEAHGLRGG